MTLRHILPALAILALLASGCTAVRNTYNSITGSGQTTKPQTESPNAGKSDTTMPATSKTGAEVDTEALSALQTETLIDRMIFGRWVVADAGGKAVEPNEDGMRPYVVFDSTAVNPFILKVYAYTGCNTVNGRLALTKGGHLQRVGDFASTLRMCPDAEAEGDIITALNGVNRYRLERLNNNYLLYFYPDASGKASMVLRRNDMSFLDGAWTVTAIPPIKINSDDLPEPMRLVFDMTEGHLHGNTGCNVLNAKISTDITTPNSLTITDPITTRMACPNAGLEQQLTNALTRVASASQAKSNTVNLLDAAGNTVLTLKRLNLD